MNKNKKQQAQILKYSNLLKTIAIDIDAEDKKLYMAKYIKSEATVSRYLNGNVKSPSIASSMYSFFKGRIDNREKQLA